jgi:hypothetical protein
LIKYSDLTINCKQCGKDFVFSEDEQEFYKTRGFSTPQRCKSCRASQRQQAKVCTECGSSFVEGAPVYCAACLINQRLELEQKNNELQKALELTATGTDSQICLKQAALESETQKALDEALNRVAEAEAEQASLSKLLQQKAKEAAELQLRLNVTNLELEKSSQYRASMEKLEPVLASLKDKLNSLENNQNAMAELLLKLSDKFEETPKNGLMDSLRGFFRAPDYQSPSR